MKNAFLTFFVVAASAGLAAAQGPSVATPNTPVECVPTLINWTGGQPPFTLVDPGARRERHPCSAVPWYHWPVFQLVHEHHLWHQRRLHCS
ncbi:hypothetical protein PsYK624_047410 [Phanerochaete sordida]|uniref:Secreted protein n=1 Tax=Phanerochaete sordida TaxID=48140 RepID=A0A9P3G5H7_9APHY|nr:hypothetical protein PsYK624_047410 [Phanerochaete sordida]